MSNIKRKLSIFKCLKFKYLTKYSAKISTDKITEIFFEIDEFFKVFEPALRKNLLTSGKRPGTDLAECQWAR